MDRQSLMLWCAAGLMAAALPVLGADNSSRYRYSGDEFQIALSPEAAAQSIHNADVDLCRRALKGDSASREKFNRLSMADRNALISEVALTKDVRSSRALAVKELAAQYKSDDPQASGLVSLARVAVAESDSSLRKLATKGLVARNDDRTPSLLALALKHQDGLVRENAIQALKAIGGPRVFEVIIEHWRESWGPGPRGYVMFGQQRSYVGDYDVAGDSYDPVIRSFITGVVLDVKSLHIEGDLYRMTIQQVAGDDVKAGNNPLAWEKWLEKERKNLAKEAESRRKDAIAALHDNQEE